ncbi:MULTISPECIES: SDR family oxidoreductase [Olivibacter]|uniref:SDR family oxidoreductase n=1 Tax=Olivibacter oleidegradans TaxID=760123 RepID=A0ABV6HI26_9SPHI|nr:SDR family oxidoreductase [Olivibacter sp. LS-1]QEL00244.1 SDR family oxidoreductase [Olivibacter sp. LS-1]
MKKCALITGATKGIGKSIACALAKEGFDILLSARTENDLLTLQSALESRYPDQRFYYQVADCKDQQQVKALALQTDAFFSHLDVLVNNVGLFVPGGFLEESPESLADHLAVNVLCTHYLAVYFGRKMCQRKSGHVFNVGSVAGKSPFVKAASYSVTKYAVHGLTAILRQELGTYGVKVTEIIPGSTYTSSWEGVDIPSEKFVAAEDIADAVVTCLKMSKGANVDEIVIRPLDLEI